MGEEYELSLRRSLLHAHIAERQSSSGLGDVTGISVGGVEIRTRPGSPFHGKGMQKGPGSRQDGSADMEMTLVWPEEIGHHTSEYIDDDDWKERISNSGESSIQSLLEDGGRGVGQLFFHPHERLWKIAVYWIGGRGNILNKVESAISKTGEGAIASLCLLGNSVVITRRD